MTTRDFIEKTYNNSTYAGHDRHCSSVFTDQTGIVYSYGYHYPLAFNIKGLDFINNAGYSSSTAKHIAWARQALNYEYTSVELNDNDARIISATWATDEEKLTVITAALERELKRYIEEMNSKKRQDTQVFRKLERRAASTIHALDEVRSIA